MKISFCLLPLTIIPLRQLTLSLKLEFPPITSHWERGKAETSPSLSLYFKKEKVVSQKIPHSSGHWSDHVAAEIGVQVMGRVT